jgi:hypothetical protein
MRVEFRHLTTQQRAVVATVSHYWESIGKPVEATYVAERLGISKQRVYVYFRRLFKFGWLRGPGSPAIPTGRLPRKLYIGVTRQTTLPERQLPSMK